MLACVQARAREAAQETPLLSRGNLRRCFRTPAQEPYRYFFQLIYYTNKLYILYILLSQVYIGHDTFHSKEDVHIFISYNKKNNTDKIKRETYFIINTIVILLYTILYTVDTMLHH